VWGIEQGVRERAPRWQGGNRTHGIPPPRRAGRRDARDERHIVHLRRFLIVVDEREQIDVGERRDLAKQVVRTNAIAAVRRVRQSMRENEDSHDDGDG
jgi:hypothetical protein